MERRGGSEAARERGNFTTEDAEDTEGDIIFH